MDKKLNDMNPTCQVGFGGANAAVEQLWKYVYELVQEVNKLKEKINKLEIVD